MAVAKMSETRQVVQLTARATSGAQSYCPSSCSAIQVMMHEKLRKVVQVSIKQMPRIMLCLVTSGWYPPDIYLLSANTNNKTYHHFATTDPQRNHKSFQTYPSRTIIRHAHQSPSNLYEWVGMCEVGVIIIDCRIGMQPATTQKKKYVMEEYISPNRANPIIKNFNQEKCALSCLCESKDPIGFTCFKCNTFVHHCLANKPNRGELYECCSCLNKSLDPLIQVRRVLVESFFRTFPIFEYVNIFNFEFTLTHEDLGFPVEVRGLFPENTTLSWPMQGAFYINDQKNSICDLKPLLCNSNRKHRREEYFSVPPDKLKLGKNFIRFKIPCLDRGKFTSKYQHEDKKVYYMSVNSVQRLSPGDLQTQTFRERRVQKAESLKILKSNNAEIEVTQNKVCLVCPYTRERIKVPVRGRYCKHFSCICLQTLIVTHSSSRHWGCPICELKMNEPYVDVWIYNMLKDNQLGSEVNVKEDGTYEWVKVDQTAMMNLDSEDESSSRPLPPPAKKPEPKPQVVMKKELEPKAKQAKQTSEPKEIPPKKPPPPQASIIFLDDDEDDITQRKKEEFRRQVIKKARDNLKKPKMEGLASKSLSESKKPKESVEPQQGSRKEDRSISKPKVPFLSEVKLIQCKQMKHEQFKKLFFRSKVNTYRRHVQNEEFKRIFKDIL